MLGKPKTKATTTLLTFFLVLAFFVLSCEKKVSEAKGPKKILTEYISKSFEVDSLSDRQELETYLTGDARSHLMNWSDEQFERAFIKSKREFVKLKFREVKKPSSEKVNITYELTYLDQGKNDAKVTNRKLCHLSKVQGKWKISGVRNIKELVEYQNEMSLP